jgi:hypothetical protein
MFLNFSQCFSKCSPFFSQNVPNDPTFSEKAMSPQGPEKMLRLTLALMVTTAFGRGEHFLGKADSQIRKAMVNKPLTKIVLYRSMCMNLYDYIYIIVYNYLYI